MILNWGYEASTAVCTYHLAMLKKVFFIVKQVFKDLDFLGWYATGGPPTEVDVKIHQQICTFTESPIFLKLNPMAPTTDVRN